VRRVRSYDYLAWYFSDERTWLWAVGFLVAAPALWHLGSWGMVLGVSFALAAGGVAEEQWTTGRRLRWLWALRGAGVGMIVAWVSDALYERIGLRALVSEAWHALLRQYGW